LAFPQPIVHLKDITARIRDRWILQSTTWKIMPGENWVVLGPNGSGKTTLAKVLTGEVPIVAGEVDRFREREEPLSIGYISFELAQKTIDADRNLDGSRHFGQHPDAVTTVGELFGEPEKSKFFKESSVWMDLAQLWDQPVRGLSNGELRKVLIARVLAKDPSLLVLDEPFDGLDRESGLLLKSLLTRIIASGRQMVLVTHRFDEILPEITHAICLQSGKVVHQGALPDALAWLQENRLYDAGKISLCQEMKPLKPEEKATDAAAAILEMKDISISYGPRKVIENLTWRVGSGEHWAITGPNGSGKTTLMGLISADHLQGYANDIRLFGKQRGSGESIWEIKRDIGIVTAEFQIRYHRSLSVIDAVLSGFFDSVGLYRSYTSAQAHAAKEWMDLLSISHIASQSMDFISYGERRLVLLARALVKSPRLVILDEPCQGLDPANRRQFLELIDRVGHRTRTQILYVTHHHQEIPRCITHRLSLMKPYSQGPMVF
jgi:molybdate transport system ATP-binding protein